MRVGGYVDPFYFEARKSRLVLLEINKSTGPKCDLLILKRPILGEAG